VKSNAPNIASSPSNSKSSSSDAAAFFFLAVRSRIGSSSCKPRRASQRKEERGERKAKAYEPASSWSSDRRRPHRKTQQLRLDACSETKGIERSSEQIHLATTQQSRGPLLLRLGPLESLIWVQVCKTHRRYDWEIVFSIHLHRSISMNRHVSLSIASPRLDHILPDRLELPPLVPLRPLARARICTPIAATRGWGSSFVLSRNDLGR
jgi:hypothetical protein